VPNGFHGSKEEWERLEAPLLVIDDCLLQFAQSHGMELRRNYHNWPERSLKWHVGPLEKLIQIALVDTDGDQDLRVSLGICAVRDSNDKRFWKNRILAGPAPIKEIEQHLDSLLVRAKEMLDAWTEKDLERA
jgi:hypothetical protein